jgi:hypothetical protein
VNTGAVTTGTIMAMSLTPEQDGQPIPASPLQAKLDEAWARHRAICLWNLRRPSALDDVPALIHALRVNGNMDAWRLAAEIEEMAAKEER